MRRRCRNNPEQNSTTKHSLGRVFLPGARRTLACGTKTTRQSTDNKLLTTMSFASRSRRSGSASALGQARCQFHTHGRTRMVLPPRPLADCRCRRRLPAGRGAARRGSGSGGSSGSSAQPAQGARGAGRRAAGGGEPAHLAEGAETTPAAARRRPTDGAAGAWVGGWRPSRPSPWSWSRREGRKPGQKGVGTRQDARRAAIRECRQAASHPAWTMAQWSSA